MGVLNDITIHAANTIKRQSHSSVGYQSLNSPKKTMDRENLGKSKSPHFMTPTVSSSKQSVPANTKLNDRTSSPTNLRPVKAEGGNAWMKSAVKRVGFRRTGEASRSKKDSPSQHTGAVGCPDKLATPSHQKLPGSPASNQERIAGLSPKDKPLPSPPMAQTGDLSSILESKSLIDARDRPLRRQLTPEKAEPEDWPVLEPTRRTVTGTLQEMMRESGSQLTQQAISVENERYPILGNTVRQVPSGHQLPVSKYSSTANILRKEVPSPNIGVKGENNNPAVDSVAYDRQRISDPFKDGIYDSGPVLPAKDLPPFPCSESVQGAVVVESAQETKAFIEPRQTRTSSLRARLSAGQSSRVGQSKITGSTESTTADTVKGAPWRASLRHQKAAQACRSVTPPVGNLVRKKSSTGSISSSRAPAAFVAGSRRPAHPRRPSSRGSHLIEHRIPSPPLPPNRLAPPRPVSRGEDVNLKKNDTSKGHAAPTFKAQKSSIPVSRMTVERPSQGADKVSSPEQMDIKAPPTRKEPRDELGGIYREDPFADLVDELHATPHSTAYDGRTQVLPDNSDSRVLEAIEESPQHAYQFKRLSINSPDFGPTLKISPSAERFIMGHQENRSATKKKGKELDRLVIKEEPRTYRAKTKSFSAAKPFTATKETERPSSSQGLSRLSSRVGLVDRDVRERKAKSVDLSQLSPYSSRKDVVRSNSDLPCRYHDSGAKLHKPSTSSDPFFDAPEEPISSLEDAAISRQAESEPSRMIDEATWISPLEKKKSRSGDDETLVLDEYLSAQIGERFKDDLKEHDLSTEIKQSPKAVPGQDFHVITKDFAQQSAESKVATGKHAPSTPERNQGKHRPRSDRHPPRSSSRTNPPDFTDSKAHRSSPLVSDRCTTPVDYTNTKNPRFSPLTSEKKPPTPAKDPPKEYSRRQNNLGSLRGYQSSQLDLNNPSSNRDPTKRDSAAHDSHRSQGSVSRGVLSNFRGLFHKRSSENEPLKSGKKLKSKVSINASGSPFPPISEIHPIHRPTLASINRSNAPTPHASSSATPVTPSFTSPTPSGVSTSTALAMQLLESARYEPSSPRKERLLKLGQIMVDAITQAREAEKAMEEAKQASRKAEVAHALCQKSLGEMEKVVRDYRNEVGSRRGYV